MQRFDRSALPAPMVLTSSEALRARQQLFEYMSLDTEKRLQTSPPRSNIGSLNEHSMHRSLQMLFHGKCAFCEAKVETKPYRFRPDSNALPTKRSADSHLYYAWLAEAWENFYSICSSCEPTDPTQFPVDGRRVPVPSLEEIRRYAADPTGLWRGYPLKETAMLLDPCGPRDFHASLSPLMTGVLHPLSPRGQMTIGHFNLNASERMRARTRAYRGYIDVLVNGRPKRSDDKAAFEVFDFPELEFGGSWYLLLRRAASQMGYAKTAGPKGQVRIRTFFDQLTATQDGRDAIRQAFHELTDDDVTGKKNVSLPAYAPPGSAPVKSIQIEHFKAIESLSLVISKHETVREEGLAPSLLILGENAVGKSSILEAVALTLCSADARQTLKLRASSVVLDPTLLGGLPGHEYARMARVEVRLTDGRKRVLEASNGNYAERIKDFRPEEVPVFAYGAFRQFQPESRKYSAGAHIRNLFDGRPLPNPEPWLISLEKQKFDAVVRALRDMLSIEGEFDVIERDHRSGRCYLRTEQHTRDGHSTFTRTPFGLVSSGFRSVLAMACDVMQGLMNPRVNKGFEAFANCHGIVLVDEVEAHLHPRWKMQVMSGLRRALPGMTFIATTHDPLCLRGMAPGEVVVLRRVDAADSEIETELPYVVEPLTDLPDLRELTVQQLLTSDFFQLYSTDSAEMDASLATIAELLAKQNQSAALLSADEQQTLKAFEADIASVLPIGNSEAQRLVQEAVAEFLQERRQAGAEKLERLQVSTRKSIKDLLRDF